MDESPKREHPNDPLHGVTLQAVVESMVERHGWHGLAREMPVRCFLFNPSVKSSLIFLRKNPWAREKLEKWYVESRLGGSAARRLGDAPLAE